MKVRAPTTLTRGQVIEKYTQYEMAKKLLGMQTLQQVYSYAAKLVQEHKERFEGRS